jgi:hypothetical protein
MPNDNVVSGPPSAATSRNEPPKSARMTEEAFLREQASQARGALAATLRDLRTSLLASADVRQWTRQHPWAATGAAAAAGFAVAAAVVPRPKKEGEPATETAPAPRPEAEHNGHAAEGGHPSLLAAAVAGLFRLAVPAVTAWVKGAAQTWAASGPANEGSDAEGAAAEGPSPDAEDRQAHAAASL